MKPYNIYISGVGGQGIIKTSIIMGEAAIKMGWDVVMSEIHGMAQRGGVVSTEIRIGEAEGSIIPDGSADLLLSFEPLEALRAVPKISRDSYIVTNTSPIMPFNIKESKYPYPDVTVILENLKSKSKKVFPINAIQIAKEAGHILSLNMVMLGGAASTPGFPLKKELLMESMKANLPGNSLPINLKAFEEGFQLCSSI